MSLSSMNCKWTTYSTREWKYPFNPEPLLKTVRLMFNKESIKSPSYEPCLAIDQIYNTVFP